MLNVIGQSTVSSFPLQTASAQPYPSARRTDKGSLFTLLTRALVLAAGSFLLVASLVDPPAMVDSRPRLVAMVLSRSINDERLSKQYLQAATESVLMELPAGDAQQGSLQ
jgi:hypothetical protein